MITNADRAELARLALQTFREACSRIDEEDPSETIGILITDLMHLCDQCKINPMLPVRQGISHYVAERLDAEGAKHQTMLRLDVEYRAYDTDPRQGFLPFEWEPT